MTPSFDRSSPKFCATCGNSLRAGAKFCAGCGSPVITKSTPPTVDALPPYTPPAQGGTSDPTQLFPSGQQPYMPPKPLNAPVTPPSLPTYYQQSAHQAIPFSNKVSRVNLSQALQFPFASSNWLVTMLIGGLIIFVPVIGFMAVYGYMTEIIRRVANDDYDILPGWDNFGVKLKDGLLILVLLLMWAFLPVLLLSAPGFLIAYMGDEEIGSMILSIGALLGLFITYFFVPIVWGRYAVTDQFMSGLQISQIWEQTRTNFGRYVGNWLLTGLMLFISIAVISIFASITGALMIFLVGLCFVPFVLIASFYMTLIQSHLMGQLYRTIM